MSGAKNEPTVGAMPSFTVTDLKQRTRQVIDLVGAHKPVAIVRHKAAEAVLISPTDYTEYMQLKRERLNLLTEQYDRMIASMQTVEAAAGVDSLFNATLEELGRAAVVAAKRD